jgi:CheY-like chemotaxis protein
VAILLDLKLPRVSGLEVLKTLKTHPSYRSIPVVVLTSSAASRDVETAYELGANSYIVKPVDFDKFHAGGGADRAVLAVINRSPG